MNKNKSYINQIRKHLLILFLCSTVSFTWGQFKNFNTENALWYEGNVLLLDGSTVEGQLNFNFVSGVLRVKQGGAPEIFTSEKVLSFEFYKAGENQTFYSLPYDQGDTGRDVPTYFEVVYQLDNIAVLSRHSFEFSHKNFLAGNEYSNYSEDDRLLDLAERKETIYQTIYLADNRGNIIPYLSKKKKANRSYELFGFHEEGIEYDERKFRESQLEKEVKVFSYVEKDALDKVVDDKLTHVKSFIKKEKLNPKTLEDLISILAFYNELN
ncbi:hypothetical protein E1176_06535 [Fulvivirga sp. RKSG066]|uniref:hypothetical protein n=1 Tax=Fulvivirga aurantia TaxID=2529383 RepID=UPI0012BD3AF9|nr:hypothetical protein [Fulvivirga aurantia]MTI20672.1 hypothetical protein [Fulvivirga aurantia]